MPSCSFALCVQPEEHNGNDNIERCQTLLAGGSTSKCSTSIDVFHSDARSRIVIAVDKTLNVFVLTTSDANMSVPTAELSFDKVETTTESIVKSLVVSPDGSLMATGHENGAITFWNIEMVTHTDIRQLSTRKPASHVQGPVRDILFHPRRYWALAAYSRHLVMWDLETHGVVFEKDIGMEIGMDPPLHLLCDGTLIQKKEQESIDDLQAMCLQLSELGHLLLVGCSNGVMMAYRFDLD